MDDTPDKAVSPAAPTDQEAPLTDKDLGQETKDTGESHNESDPSTATPQAEAGSEGTDETATSEGEEGQTEETLLTPEEIANLDPKLKAQYVSMNKRFQSGMRQVNQLIEKAKTITETKPPETPKEDAGDDRPVFLDRARLAQAKSNDDVVAVLEEGLNKLADYIDEKKLRPALEPFHQREAAAEVKSYFEKYPDRTKFKAAMGKLDLKTKGTMTIDELFYAVSGQEREATEAQRKDKKLRNLSKGNSESATGTTGKPQGEGDVFDEMAKAGGRGNSVLL